MSSNTANDCSCSRTECRCNTTTRNGFDKKRYTRYIRLYAHTTATVRVFQHELTLMNRTIISMHDYQKVINVVNSHCGVIVSWQKTSVEHKCMVLISKSQSKKVLLSHSLRPLTLCTMRSRFRWRNARVVSATMPSLTWGWSSHNFFANTEPHSLPYSY